MKTDTKFKTLVAILFILYLVPIWRFRYFPSQDGPSHIYVTEVLSSLTAGQSAYEDYFRLNIRPFPNWSAYGVMWFFQRFASPLTAEKLFLTIYLGLMVLSFWYLLSVLGRPHRLWALFALPLGYNYTLFMGFYNFCFGLPLVLFTLGFWWRWREKWGPGRLLVLAVLLLLVYFCHPVPIGLVLACLAGMAVVYYRFRLKPVSYLLVSFIPVLTLFAYNFLGDRAFAVQPSSSSFWRLPQLIVDFVKMRSILAFDAGRQAPIALGLAAILWSALLVTIRKRCRRERNGLHIDFQPRDVFVIPLLISLLLYVVLPNRIGEGGVISARMNLFSTVLVIPLLSEDFGKRTRVLFTAALGVLLLVNLAFLYSVFAINNQRLDEFVAGRDAVSPGSVFLPLVFDKGENDELVWIYAHAPNYYCFGRGIVNLSNYHMDWFSRYVVTWKRDVPRPGIRDVEALRDRLDFGKLSEYVDYVLTFGEEPETIARVEEYFRPVFKRGRVRIFASRKPNPEVRNQNQE